MKIRERNRYLVRIVLDTMPDDLTPSERLILMFLYTNWKINAKGATQEEIQKATGVKERSFSRAWKTLQKRNYIMSERTFLLTEQGTRIGEQILPAS